MEELQSILKDRIRLANAKVPKGVFNRIIHYGINEGGSAREVLDLGRRTVASKAHTIKDVEIHINELKHEEWERYIQLLPNVKRKFLMSASMVANGNSGSVTSQEMQKEMDRSPTYTSNLLAEFTHEGLFERMENKNTGRRGGNSRYRYKFNKHALRHITEHFKDSMALGTLH